MTPTVMRATAPMVATAGVRSHACTCAANSPALGTDTGGAGGAPAAAGCAAAAAAAGAIAPAWGGGGGTAPPAGADDRAPGAGAEGHPITAHPRLSCQHSMWCIAAHDPNAI